MVQMLCAYYGDGVVADARKQRNKGGGRGGRTQAVSNSCYPLKNFELVLMHSDSLRCYVLNEK